MVWRRSIDHIRLSIRPPSRPLGLSIAYVVPFASYLTLNNRDVTLKSGLKVTQGHSNWYHSKAEVRFPISLHNIMALSCIISEIKRDIGRKSLGWQNKHSFSY